MHITSLEISISSCQLHSPVSCIPVSWLLECVIIWKVETFTRVVYTHLLVNVTKCHFNRYDWKKRKEKKKLIVACRERKRSLESNCWLRDNLVKMIKNGPVSEIELNERREIVAALFVALWIYHFFPQFSFFVSPSLCPALFLPFLLFSSRRSRKNSFIRHHIESVVEERTFTPTNETSNDWKLATKEENIRVILTIRIETRWFRQRLGNLICRKATRPNSLPLIISLASTVHDSSLIEGYSLEKQRHTATLQSVSIDVAHLRIYYTNEYDSIEDESLFMNIFIPVRIRPYDRIGSRESRSFETIENRNLLRLLIVRIGFPS